jgi:hypothetical protein
MGRSPGRCHRQLLGFPAGRTAKVEVAGSDDRLGTLVDELHRDVTGGNRITFTVQVDQFELFPQYPAFFVDLLHGELGALQGRLIQRRLDTGQAQGGAKLDILCLRRRSTTSGEEQAENQQDGQQSPVLRFLVHLFSP